MNTIRDNYIKREAQYKAAQYLAEKQYQKQQVAEARFEFLIFTILLTGLTCLVLAGKQILGVI